MKRLSKFSTIAAAVILQASAQKYAVSEYEIGWIYEHGLGVPSDVEKAAQSRQG